MSPESIISIISISDSGTDADNTISYSDSQTNVTARAAEHARSSAADSVTVPVENDNLFTKIFNEVYDQYQEGLTTSNIDK